ncbi:MAG: DUF402 domain-containing protein [Pyrinomonadaceae bacterium]
MILPGNIITVNSRFYDGSLKRSWTCEVVRWSDSLVYLVGRFERRVTHPDLGTIRAGSLSHEFFWPGKWYNVFRFHEPDGTFRNFYCNICMPPTIHNAKLEYVDLDIDIAVDPFGSVKVLDEQEFRENAERFGYTGQVREMTTAAIAELMGMIEGREFPFDHHG